MHTAGECPASGGAGKIRSRFCGGPCAITPRPLSLLLVPRFAPSPMDRRSFSTTDWNDTATCGAPRAMSHSHARLLLMPLLCSRCVLVHRSLLCSVVCSHEDQQRHPPGDIQVHGFQLPTLRQTVARVDHRMEWRLAQSRRRNHGGQQQHRTAREDSTSAREGSGRKPLIACRCPAVSARLLRSCSALWLCALTTLACPPSCSSL